MNQLKLAGLAVRIDSGFTWKRWVPSVSGRPTAVARSFVTIDGMYTSCQTDCETSGLVTTFMLRRP